jgi:hypothetical protein
MVKQPLGLQQTDESDHGKFKPFFTVLAIGGLTVSLASLYLLRRYQSGKSIYIDSILNTYKNLSILKNPSNQFTSNNITQKHKREISATNFYINKLQTDIQKLTKQNKILENNLIKKSQVNKSIKYKLIELEKQIINQPHYNIYNLPDTDTSRFMNTHTEKIQTDPLNDIKPQTVDTILMLANTN